MSSPDEARERRATALTLAVTTVSRVNKFSVADVLTTANLYDKYIANGTLPPQPASTPIVKEDGVDAAV